MDIIENFFGTFTWQSIITTGLRVCIILLLAWAGMKVLQKFVDRMENNLLRKSELEGEPPSESQKRIETITRLVRQGCLLALWITVAMVILREFGVEIGPIIASAGIVGLAVGFGAQNMVRDIISGFFIILENQIRVGDVAVVNGTGGLVEEINFRTTVLRDLSGVMHIFPNGTIEKLSNMTNEWSAYVFDICVGYNEDTDAVISVLKGVGRGMLEESRFRSMMLGEPEIFGVDQLAESGVIIKGRLRTKPIRQWDVGREFLRRVKLAFAENDIEIPYPHRVIFLDENSKDLATKLLAASAAGSPDAAGATRLGMNATDAPSDGTATIADDSDNAGHRG